VFFLIVVDLVCQYYSMNFYHKIMNHNIIVKDSSPKQPVKKAVIC